MREIRIETKGAIQSIIQAVVAFKEKGNFVIREDLFQVLNRSAKLLKLDKGMALKFTTKYGAVSIETVVNLTRFLNGYRVERIEIDGKLLYAFSQWSSWENQYDFTAE